ARAGAHHRAARAAGAARRRPAAPLLSHHAARRRGGEGRGAASGAARANGARARVRAGESVIVPLYRLLLRLYPVSFRNEYGSEMTEVFARRRRDAAGFFSRVALWLETIADVVTNAIVVHLDVLRQDLRYVGRTLRRSPGFATTAILTIALGIGAATAGFSVTDFVLLRPLPFPAPERLVKLYERTPGYGRLELSAANYRDWKQAATVFESIGLYHAAAGNLSGTSDPMRVEG